MEKVSFLKLWENMSLKETVETAAMKAVRTGLNIDENFWKNFMLVCNNPEGMSDLLDVSSDHIVGWGSKIQHNIDLVNKHKDQKNIKTKVIDTGNVEGQEDEML